MVTGVPLVHAFKHGVVVMNGKRRPFGNDIQLRIRHHGGDFENDLPPDIQPGHLQVHPNEIAHGFASHAFDAFGCSWPSSLPWDPSEAG